MRHTNLLSGKVVCVPCNRFEVGAVEKIESAPIVMVPLKPKS